MYGILLIFCFYFLVLFAQPPELDGPYAVGCRVDTLSRLSSTDSTVRVMAVYTWYPAVEGTGYWFEPVKAYWHADPAEIGTARPAVVFSHGGCGSPLASVYFTSHLASWGFIVIATSHPGSMWGDEDCLDSAALHDTWLNRPDDVRYTVDSMVALSLSNPHLFGLIDTARMGMSGHSFGARTTYAVCARQNWAKCAVALSGDYTDIFGAPINCMDDIRNVDVPIMLMCGSYDMGLEPAHMAEIYDTLRPPKVAVEIFGATHFSFSDTCTPILDPLCGADSVLDYEMAHSIINHYATAFFMKYLTGSSRFDSLICLDYDTLTEVWCDTFSEYIENFHIQDKNIYVYPNPFKKYCEINLPILNQYANLKIYDVFGRVIYSVNVGSNNKLIWMPSGAYSGIYFLKIECEDVNFVKKLYYIR